MKLSPWNLTALFLMTYPLNGVFAQTTGATAPEVTTFAPIETANLVDHASGDFVYSIPVMGIPGAPGGGYPLVLGYQSGILYGQEASWVGLGWNLSVGQVQRNVRGYPDDFHGAQIFFEGDDQTSRIHSQAGAIEYSGFAAGVPMVRQTTAFLLPTPKPGKGDEDKEDGQPLVKAVVTRPVNFYNDGGLIRDFWVTDESAGFVRTYRWLQGQSEAFGYLYLDKVGKTLDGQPHEEPTATNTELAGSDLLPDVFSLIQERQNAFDLDRTYRSNNTHRHYSLDTHYQDFEARQFEGDDHAHLYQSFYADYISANYDAYTVSAHGLSGSARPVTVKAGFLRPNDRVTSKSVADIGGGGPVADWQFHPYRNLMAALKRGITPFDDLEAQLQQAEWSLPTDQPNMVFMGDPGLHQESSYFDDAGGDGLVELKNRSRRIEYQTDPFTGKIIRIVAIGTDGRRYVFGQLREKKPDGTDTQFVTAGAAPQNYNKVNYSRTTTDFNGTDETISATRVVEPFAYSWHLAAVTAPDFVDKDPEGHYGPEDYGDFITFHYSLATPSFGWSTPATDQPNDEEDPAYVYMGKSRTETLHYWDRVQGMKEVYVPRYAKTRTHVAVFDQSTGDNPRLDGLSLKIDFEDERYPDDHNWVNQRKAQYLEDQHFWLGGSFLSSEDYDAFKTQFSLNNTQEILIFPLGTASRAGLDHVNDFHQISYKYCWVDEVTGNEEEGTWKGDLAYKGTFLSSDYEIFVLTGDSDPPGEQNNLPFSECEGDLILEFNSNDVLTNGFARLDGIRLFDRDVFEQAQGESSGPDLWKVYDHRGIDDSRQYLNKTAFTYTYELAKGTPNSIVDPTLNPDQGRLTLKKVNTVFRDGYRGQEEYRFDYFQQDDLVYGEFHDMDPWGYYSKTTSGQQFSLVDPETKTMDGRSFPVQAAWSLATITTPVGTQIEVDYEADTYTWVQDRYAVRPGSGTGTGNSWLESDLGNTGSSGILYDAQSGLKGPDEIRASLAVLPIPLPGGVSNKQAILRVTAVQNGTSRIGRFIVHLVASEDPNVDAAMDPSHPALEEAANWIWHTEYHPEGNITRLDVEGIPASDLPTVGMVPLTPAQGGMVGELGGGIRVKRLMFVPEGGAAGEDESFELTYDYRDPDTGLDSGAIFTDPPKVKTGQALDQRIVPAETKPYMNMPGSRVHYEFVSVTTKQGEADYSKKRDSFITARDTRTLYAFDDPGAAKKSYRQIATTFDPVNNTYDVHHQWDTQVGGEYPHRMYKWKRKGHPDDEFWEIAPMNETQSTNGEYQLRFIYDTHYHTDIVNNGALLGRRKGSLSMTAGGSTLVEETLTYAPVYGTNLTLNAPTLKAFAADANGQLMEAPIGQGGATMATHIPQGVYSEKAQSLVIRSNNNGYSFRFHVRKQNEVHNAWRQTGLVRKEYHYPSDSSLTATDVVETVVVNLAFDAVTGAPTITKTNRGTSGAAQKIYTLDVPAHQLYTEGAGTGDDMVSLNMLSQPGLSLVALADGDLDPKTGPFLPQLASGAKVQTAQLAHWRRPFPGGYQGGSGGGRSWVNDAAFGYVHDDNQKNSTGWRHLPLQDGVAALNLNVPINVPNGEEFDVGRWLAPGQNTLYDPRLNVLEHKDFRGISSAVVFIDNHRLVAARFENASADQIYYQGFEDMTQSLDPNLVVHNTFEDGHYKTGGNDPVASTDFMANYNQVHSGTRSYQGSYSIKRANSMGQVNDSFWLSYFVRGTTAVNLGGVDLVLANPPSGTNVVPVEQGWTLVRQVLTESQRDAIDDPNGLILDPGSGFLDNIAIYPAANGDRTDAQVSLFGYHPHLKRVNAITDVRGRTLRYEYDERGELFRVYDTDGKLKTKHYRAFYDQPFTIEQEEVTP